MREANDVYQLQVESNIKQSCNQWTATLNYRQKINDYFVITVRSVCLSIWMDHVGGVCSSFNFLAHGTHLIQSTCVWRPIDCIGKAVLLLQHDPLCCCCILCIGRYGARITTYSSVFKLWLTPTTEASDMAPSSLITFPARLWKRVLKYNSEV